MNVIARLEFELAYYDVAVQRINHCTTGTYPKIKFSLLVNCISTFLGYLMPNTFFFRRTVVVLFNP